MTAMPVLFQAHGAPPLLDDPGWIAELAAWARVLPRPRAVVVISAHWEARPLALGAVGPLRDDGVLVIGSGFLTHNLRAMSQPTPAWASEFDAWTADVLARRDVDALLDYRRRAPGVRESLPTHEHFVPAIVAAGAAG